MPQPEDNEPTRPQPSDPDDFRQGPPVALPCILAVIVGARRAAEIIEEQRAWRRGVNVAA